MYVIARWFIRLRRAQVDGFSSQTPAPRRITPGRDSPDRRHTHTHTCSSVIEKCERERNANVKETAALLLKPCLHETILQRTGNQTEIILEVINALWICSVCKFYFAKSESDKCWYTLYTSQLCRFLCPMRCWSFGILKWDIKTCNLCCWTKCSCYVNPTHTPRP